MIERSSSGEETSLPAYRLPGRSARPVAVVVGVLALAAVALAVWAAVEGSGGRWIVVVVAVGAWAGCGFVVTLRRGALPLGPLMAMVALTGGVAVAGSAAFDAHGGDGSAGVRLVGDAVLVAVLFHVAMSVPSGRLVATLRPCLVGAGYLAAVALVAIRWNDRTDLPVGPLARARRGVRRDRRGQLRGLLPGRRSKGASRPPVDGLGCGHHCGGDTVRMGPRRSRGVAR